jgi:hypothetical protein
MKNNMYYSKILNESFDTNKISDDEVIKLEEEMLLKHSYELLDMVKQFESRFVEK